MTDSIQPVASSLEALSGQYRAITQNLANSNTVGYKRRCDAFQQTLASRLSDGAVTENSSVDFTQGSLAPTGRTFDLALDGPGFFVIETPRGPLYTRNGTFHLDGSGKLVDHAGRGVAGEGGQIVVPTSVSSQNVNVAADGQVFAGGKAIGKLRVVEFKDPRLLEGVGGNCFAAPAGAAPAGASKASVRQGYQESSNVNVVQELVGLITVTRLYEANLKSVQVQDERLKNLLGAAMR